MARALLVLANNTFKARAIDWIRKAPKDTRVEFKGPKRTIPQNDRMWAMLTEISVQLPWHGMKLSPDDWKLVFLDALKREVRMVPNIDGNGFVNLGRSSSDLDKEEMADLLTIIEAFGVQNGVVFQDQRERAA